MAYNFLEETKKRLGLGFSFKDETVNQNLISTKEGGVTFEKPKSPYEGQYGEWMKPNQPQTAYSGQWQEGYVPYKKEIKPVVSDLPIETALTTRPYVPPEEIREIDVLGSLKTFGEGLTYLDDAMRVSIYSGLQGWQGATAVQKDKYDKRIELAQKNLDKFVQETYKEYEDKEVFPGIAITDIAQLPQNIAFSLTSMGAGLGAALPFAGSTPIAWTIGSSMSGKVAFNMASYEVMQEYLEAKNEEMKEKEGRELTPKEENELKDLFGAKAMEYGLWEAIPEVAGQAISLNVLLTPLTKIAGAEIATRILIKLSEMYTGELVTEAVTEMAQLGIREEAGLPGGRDVNWNSPTDWLEALKAVAPQTFLLTTIMGGAGQGVVSTGRVLKSLKTEVTEKSPLYRDFKLKINELGQQIGQQMASEKGAIRLPIPEEMKPRPEEAKAVPPPVGKEVIKEAKPVPALPKIPPLKRPPTVTELGLKEKPIKVTKNEYTLLKERIRNQAKGARGARIETRKEIQKSQQDFIDFIKKLPIKERGKLITTIKNIQSPSKLAKAIEQLEPKIVAIGQAQILAKTLGSKRSKLAFIRKIGEFNQTVINEIKRSIGYKGSVYKADMEQLDSMIDELKKRIRFKYVRGFRPKIKDRGTSKPEISEETYTANREIIGVKRGSIRQSYYEVKDKIKKGIKGGAEDILSVISTRLKKIDPTLKDAIRWYHYHLGTRVVKDLKAVVPYLESKEIVKKFSREDHLDFDLALKNRDTKKIKEIIKKYGIEREYYAVKKVFEKIEDEVKKVGGDMGHIPNYWPREIQNTEKFLEYITEGEAEIWSKLREALQKRSMELGRVLTFEEQAGIINKMVRGYHQSQISLAKVGSMKTRVIDFVDPEMNQFYYDSDEALVRYITRMDKYIEARKFFGKEIGTKEGEEWNNINDSIGAYTMKLIVEKKITPEQEMELSKILKAHFIPKGTTGVVGEYKNLAYLTTLKNFRHAVTQLSELASSVFLSGWGRTIKALPKVITGKTPFDLKDLGIERIMAEFEGRGKLGKAVDTQFKLIGLTGADRFSKRVLIYSSLLRLQDEAKSPSPKFLKDLKRIFGEEADSVLDDLREGRNSEGVKFLVFNDLSDVQPITYAEVPVSYMQAGNARIFYLLRTYDIKLLDIYRNKVFDVMKENRLEGVKQFIRLTTLLLLFGATTDEIKDFMLGRKTSFTDRMIDNLLKISGFSRYTAYQVRQKGWVGALKEEIIPPLKPFEMMEDLFKDIGSMFGDYEDSVDINNYKIWKEIPYGGDLYYWWFGKGVEYKEKYEETGKRKKWKLEETGAKTTGGRKKWSF